MRKTLVLIAALAMVVAAIPAAGQEVPERTDRPIPERIEDLKLSSPRTADPVSLGAIDHGLVGAQGEVAVIVRLTGDSLAESGITSDSRSARHVAATKRAQQALERDIKRLDRSAEVTNSVQRTINAMFVRIDASALPELAANPNVERIAPIGVYELDLSETVPYIGAIDVQDLGFDGSGIEVAVLDSGIDYTHANLGGAGTLEAYAEAYADFTSRDGLFPTAKVVGGYDFVGEEWPLGPLGFDGPISPDPDPIDFEGHGTHVADIIAGEKGVAPGASLHAVKVCSAVSPSCSGEALILGMEYVVDPNGDGRIRDRVDIVNMSLGSLYGQPFDDDLSAAVDGASALGVLTVASAGNSGDVPFITGSPAAADTALSVAQTAVPSEVRPLMEILTEPGAGFYDAAFFPWSAELTSPIEGPVVYGDGVGGNLDGCAAFGTDLTGEIVAVDRGGCFFSDKIRNIQNAGGILGIVVQTSSEPPFAGAFGGGDPITIPGFMVGLETRSFLVAGAEIRFDPEDGIPLVGSVVSTSSRGPQFDDLRIKPEIGAPGASVSAEVGTGTGETPFGGTSGAAPMVAGAAALMLDATGESKTTGNGRPPGRANGFPLSPVEAKALLMNTADPDILSDGLDIAAEVSRIGGGEVRVNQASVSSVLAYDADEPTGALSFGYVDVTGTTTLTKTVEVVNLSGERQTLTIDNEFRAPGPEGSGAVTVSAPSEVRLRPGNKNVTQFEVTITIDGSKLTGNPMNSGGEGGNPAALTASEFDGYLTLSGGTVDIKVPWHVLPRKAAEVSAATADLIAGSFPQSIDLSNGGVGTAQLDAYTWVVADEELPEGDRGAQSPTPDIAGVGVTTFPVPAGFCSAQPSFLWAFAFDYHERQTHAIAPGISWLDLDTDQDGTPDHAVFTYSFAFLGDISVPEVVTWAAPYTSFPDELGPASAFFFAEHATVSGNQVMYICGEQIGLTGTDLLATNVDVTAYAFDIYFGGPGDVTDPFTITPLGEGWFGVPAGDIAGGGSGTLDVFDFGLLPGNTPELGVMLVTNGDRGAGNRGGATEPTETVYFEAP